MRTPEQIAERLAATIRHVYARPSMYTRPENIETTLWDFHWAWAIVHGNEQLFREIHGAKLREFDANAGLYSRYKHDDPDASESDALDFVIQQWRLISTATGIPLENEQVGC